MSVDGTLLEDDDVSADWGDALCTGFGAVAAKGDVVVVVVVGGTVVVVVGGPVLVEVDGAP